MNGKQTIEREHWGGNLGFILASAGSAIGLGNIWKFPYITGENGGGAFVLVYLACILIIGLPVMICEITLGRNTQQNPFGAFRQLAPNASKSTSSFGILCILIACGLLCFGRFGLSGIFFLIGIGGLYYGWAVVGLVCVFTPIVIMSYYGTVGGWTIAYFFKGITQGLDFTTVEAAKQTFDTFSTNAYWPVFFQLLFMILTGVVVWFGIRNGIELASKFLLPLLLVLLLILVMRSLTLDGAREGVRFLLSPDFSKLTPNGVLVALGHAFFSLSLGMGAMITYGSYFERTKNIFSASAYIVILDTMIAMIAGLAIFPAVFAMKMDPQCGPGLVFQIMPITFNLIGDHLGWLWISIFFLLLIIAALTSSISMLEVCVAYLMDEFKVKRHAAVFWTTVVVSIVGIICTLSVTNWDRFPWLQQAIVWAFGDACDSAFALADTFSSNYLLPLGGLGIAVFVGWIWGTRFAIDEIRKGGQQVPDANFFVLLAGLKDDPITQAKPHIFTLAIIWGIFVRFISPVAIIVAFLNSIGWLHF
ncbi:MAG: sodium-dependent transporter [Planctomycetia bacterium]|nr:sodium-dependent transporter [Planctomycetia bacterium]